MIQKIRLALEAKAKASRSCNKGGGSRIDIIPERRSKPRKDANGQVAVDGLTGRADTWRSKMPPPLYADNRASSNSSTNRLAGSL